MSEIYRAPSFYPIKGKRSDGTEFPDTRNEYQKLYDNKYAKLVAERLGRFGPTWRRRVLEAPVLSGETKVTDMQYKPSDSVQLSKPSPEELLKDDIRRISRERNKR